MEGENEVKKRGGAERVKCRDFAKMMCSSGCSSSKDKSVGKISPSGPDWVDDTNVTQVNFRVRLVGFF